MRELARQQKAPLHLSAWVGATLGLLLLLGLVFAAAAPAAYEQVANFGNRPGEGIEEGGPGEEPGDMHLPNSAQAAVNYTGAGGVTPGNLYTANSRENVANSGHVESGVTRWSPKGELLGHWSPPGGAAGVAVDETTGNVYVTKAQAAAGQPVILVYNADGSQLITSFGPLAGSGETIPASPEKIHLIGRAGTIAVDSDGAVYVSDAGFGEFNNRRVMVFEPESPGDYEHYVYAGQSHDIATGRGSSTLAADESGTVYVVTGETSIEAYDPASPSTPICSFETPNGQGGIEGMTVDPVKGEVFYFSFKNKKIHQLASCNGEGEFVQTAEFVATPQAQPFEIYALAVNPSLAWDANRPSGVLYAAAYNFYFDNPPLLGAHGEGFIFAVPEVHPPSVEAESVSAVTATTARLKAQINPKGSPTHYAFQYETKADYEANPPGERFVAAAEAPLGGDDLPASQETLGAAAALLGLAPETEYRFRAIATSHCNPEDEGELCQDTGEDQAFRTYPLEAPGLPDERAWEMVSPAQKDGGEVFPADGSVGSCSECKPGALGEGFPMQSSPDGEAVVYQGFPFSFTEGAANSNEYISRRDETTGWQTTILAPPLLRDSGGLGYKAFDTSLTKGILSQGAPSLTASAPSEYPNLYVQPTANPPSLSALITSEAPNRFPGELTLNYAGASDDLSHVFFAANDALTGETPFAPEAEDGGKDKSNLNEWVGGQLRLVNVLPGNAETAQGAVFGSGRFSDLPHAISADGSRAFWSDESGQVYARIDGKSTLEIPNPGKYLTASEDGSKVLLDDGHIYDLETEATTDLTEGQGGFQGIAGQSEDLSHVYFVDTAVLSGEEENEFGAKAQAGKANLYAWQEGALAFVATLLPEDNPGGVGQAGDWASSPSLRTAEASPDGRWLSFLSRASLSRQDSTGLCALKPLEGTYEAIPGPCAEAFLFDSATNKLICASCNPAGVRPLGSTTLRLIGRGEAFLPQPRYLTDEGRLYFDTRDSLSPFDSNEGVEDVYEYEPQEVGSCEREGGCVSLISAGHEAVDSNLLAVDETGENVFFTTRDQLALKDKDDLIDLYVAREGGGIPSETETARGECQGEACQPQISPPNDPTPGSSAFEGAGNVVEEPRARCAKGKIRRRGRCVRKHPRKHAHRRAAKHNRGGAGDSP
jgi:hypothetical protein